MHMADVLLEFEQVPVHFRLRYADFMGTDIASGDLDTFAMDGLLVTVKIIPG